MLSTCEFYGAERHNEKLIARCSADLPKDSFDVALKVRLRAHLAYPHCRSARAPRTRAAPGCLLAEQGGACSVRSSVRAGMQVGGVGDISGLKLDCTPSRLKETVDESLKILGKERIELLVQARQAPGTPLEEVVQCFKELVNDGVRLLAPEAAVLAATFAATAGYRVLDQHSRVGKCSAMHSSTCVQYGLSLADLSMSRATVQGGRLEHSTNLVLMHATNVCRQGSVHRPL